MGGGLQQVDNTHFHPEALTILSAITVRMTRPLLQ